MYRFHRHFYLNLLNSRIINLQLLFLSFNFLFSLLWPFLMLEFMKGHFNILCMQDKGLYDDVCKYAMQMQQKAKIVLDN